MSEHATSVALLGNTFIGRTIRRYAAPRFLQLVEVLRSQDVVLANLECTIPDPQDPPAYVAGHGWAGTHMAARVDMIEDLKYIGINGVTTGNNHVSDFGESGILSTVRHLREGGMAFAGIGASLTEAAAPDFVETASGMRVAFISACDWGPRGVHSANFPWPMGFFPSDDAPPFHPRPGINLLRYEVETHVSRDQIDALRAISSSFGWEREKILRRYGFWRSHPMIGLTTNIGVEEDTDDMFYFLGRRFVVDEKPVQRTIACDEDVQRIVSRVRDAKRQADLVFVALHDQSHPEQPHDFIQDFAHQVIDAGADVYYSNGGGQMGIEIYKNKAIMYGVSNFCLQTEAVTQLPTSDMERFKLPRESSAADFLESRAKSTAEGLALVGGPGKVVEKARGAVSNIAFFNEHAELTKIVVQPIEPLGGTTITADDEVPTPRFRRGVPLIPEPGSPICDRVINFSAELSKPFGTEVVRENDVGVIYVK